MDFELNEDQEALAEGVAALCAGRFDIETVRSMATDGLDRGRWAELAETGVFSLTRPESDGGMGMGWADAVVVFEQLGRALVPGPLVATTLTAALVGMASTDGAACADGAEIAEGAAQGTMVVGTQERSQGRCYVEFLPWIDTLVISDDEGLWSVDAAALRTEGATPAAHPLDPLTPVTAVTGLPQGRRIADAKTADEWRQCGALLTATLQLGIAGGATDLAVEYAKQREQFGKPIGAFQAVKHRCADMITRVEVLRAAVYAAGVTVDGKGVDDPARSVAVAKGSGLQRCGGLRQRHGSGPRWHGLHLGSRRSPLLETGLGA